MNNSRLALVSVVTVIFAANPSATVDDGVCSVRIDLHKKLSSALTDDTSLTFLDRLRNELMAMCVDVAVHNALVDILNEVEKFTTNENAARSVRNVSKLFKKLVKNKNFQNVWIATMDGVNAIFDNASKADKTMNLVFENVGDVFNHAKYDTDFENVIVYLMNAIHKPKAMMYKGLNKMAELSGKSGIQRIFKKSPVSKPSAGK